MGYLNSASMTGQILGYGANALSSIVTNPAALIGLITSYLTYQLYSSDTPSEVPINKNTLWNR